jgi:hypothetical protein
MVMGVLSWVIILPAALLMRNSPAEMGYKTYGTEDTLDRSPVTRRIVGVW